MVLGGFAAVSAVAHAQTSSVTLYGILDMGIAHEGNGNVNGSVTRMDSGIWSGSRLGVKGSENLGNGMSANFAWRMA